MSSKSLPEDDERDRRLGEAIDAYLEQRGCGAYVPVEEWVQRYPDLRDELRECLVALPLLAQAVPDHADLAIAGLANPPARQTGDAAAASGTESPGLPDVPGYAVLEPIGRGGMGVVYRGLQWATKRVVALKFLASGAHASAAARRRFAREVELAAALDHPAIVRIIEAGETEGRLYCVMEYVDGELLHTFLAGRELGVDEKLRLFGLILEGVQYAHYRGVIHRDLKPANILVDREGRPRILDFGLACATPPPEAESAGSRDTQEGQLLGTLPYLSPEQAAGISHEVDTRSDLYALGVVLYEMLTGRLPYDTSGSLAEALYHICHAVPPKPSRFCRHLSADVDAVVLKLLEKSKVERYQSAAELAEDLRCALRGEPVGANRGTRFYLLRKAYARHRTQVRMAGAGLLLLVLAAAVILALYVEVRRERDRLSDQLQVSALRHGLTYLAAGQDMLAENVLRSAYLRRPDPRAYWSLLSFYVQNPLMARIDGASWVTALSYSPDGRFFAWGDLHGTLTLGEGSTGARLQSTQGHIGAITGLLFCPGRDRLATSGADGRIRLWCVPTLELLGELQAHPGGVTQLRCPRRPDELISAGNDGRVLFWGGTADRPPRTLFAADPPGPIAAADVSASGDLLALATSDNIVRLLDPSRASHGPVLDASGPEPPTELERFSKPVEAVRFSPDERTLAVWSGGEVSMWDVVSATRRWRAEAGPSEPRPTSLWDRSPGPHVCWVPTLEFADDGTLLAASGWDVVVRLWSADRGEPRGTLRAHGTAVYALTFRPRTHLLAAGYIGQIRIWDLDRHPGMLSQKVAPGLERTCVAVSARAALMFWGDSADDGGALVRGMRIAPPNETSAWRVLETPSDALAVDAAGRWLALADRQGGLAILDVAARQEAFRWPSGACVRALAFSSDGRRLAVGRLSGRLEIYNCPDGSLEYSWTAHEGPVLALAFASGGGRVASGGADWRARVWQIGQPQPVAEWPHGEWVNAVAFSPDGRRLATGSADLGIYVGVPGKQPELNIRLAHGHWVNAVAFLDHGRMLVSGGNDGELRFWDASSGQELASLLSPWGAVQTLAVTEDERFLAVGAAGGVQLIDLGAAAELVQRDAPRRDRPDRK